MWVTQLQHQDTKSVAACHLSALKFVPALGTRYVVEMAIESESFLCVEAEVIRRLEGWCAGS